MYGHIDSEQWYYTCDRCEYEGREYLQRPAAEPGEQVLCPDCHAATLRREATAVQE